MPEPQAHDPDDQASGTNPARDRRSPQTTKRPGSMTWALIMERVTRIELALSAWEADVLPLNYTRVRRRLRPVS